MKLWNYIKEKMMCHPKQIICESGVIITYEEAVIWAEHFSEKIKKYNCVSILCKSEIFSALSLLACFAANVTAIPLSKRYGTNHCNKILNTISPEAIILDINEKIDVYKITESHYSIPKDQPTLIMCTSGTTGNPKGAMLNDKNIITNVSDICDYLNTDDSDTILISRPIYHCAVLTGEFLVSLVKGTKICFYSENFNPKLILDLIEKLQVTTFCGTPSLLYIISQFNIKNSIKTLRHICISGECLDKDLGIKIKDAFNNCEIYHVYGLTEACPRVTYLPPELFQSYPDYVGIPLKSVSIKVLKDDVTQCKVGEEGLLYVKGDNIMQGYFNDQKSTERILSNGWLCTGDIAVINNHGLLKIKGRNDDLIIKCGMNIYPSEIEATLHKDSRVKEVLAYGYSNKYGIEIGIKIAGDFNSENEVKKLCIKLLPKFQVPSRIELLKELKKNGSGKVIRKE